MFDSNNQGADRIIIIIIIIIYILMKIHQHTLAKPNRLLVYCRQE